MNALADIAANAIAAERIDQVEQRVQYPLQLARAIKIHSEADQQSAGELIRSIRGLRQEVQAAFQPIVKKAHEAHKAALEQQKKAEAPLIEAEGIVGRLMAAWDAEQARLRREEAARLAAEARRLEEERRIREAELIAEAEGQDAAMAILDEELPICAPYIPPPPKTEGVSFRENWCFEVIDAAKVPREYLIPDEKKIGQVVRALKGSASIPGVRVYVTRTAAVRA